MSETLLGKAVRAHLLVWQANGILNYHQMKGKIVEDRQTADIEVVGEKQDRRLVIHCSTDDHLNSYRRGMSSNELGMYVGYADMAGASSTIVTLEENNPSPDTIRAGLNTAMIDALQRFRSDVSRKVDARLADIKKGADYEIPV
jgi:hypothetical protein